MKKSYRDSVLTIEFDKPDTNFCQNIMLSSDWHVDSIHCDRNALVKHLKLAKAKDAMIFVFGDMFDAMQGKFDPRRSMAELRPEYRTDRYFDVVVEDVGDLLKPYAENIALISRGNHEDSIISHNGTDLIERLVYRLNQSGGSIQSGSFAGYVRFLFGGGKISQLIMYYHHGAGGGAPMSRGILDANRQASYQPDADIVVNGHNHNSYITFVPRDRISQKGIRFSDIQKHIRTPGYKRVMEFNSWDRSRTVSSGATAIGCVMGEITINQVTKRADTTFQERIE